MFASSLFTSNCDQFCMGKTVIIELPVFAGLRHVHCDKFIKCNNARDNSNAQLIQYKVS